MVMSSSRIDISEPIPQMIERLKSEHRSFEPNIVEIQASINNNDIAHATEIVQSMT
jgi:hypothetical protein